MIARTPLSPGGDVPNPLTTWTAAWQSPEAADAVRHLGAVDQVVDQIGHRAQITAAAADRGHQLEVVQRTQQVREPGRDWGHGAPGREGPAQSG